MPLLLDDAQIRDVMRTEGMPPIVERFGREVLRLREELATAKLCVESALDSSAEKRRERDALQGKLDRVVGSGIWTLDTILKACLHVLDPDSLLASHVREKIEELADVKETIDGE